MSYSAAQLSTLEVVVRTSASLSLIGASAIMIDVLRKWSKISAAPSRITLFWVIASVLPIPWVLFARSEIPKPGTYPSTICVIQGWTLAYGFVSSAIWAGCMALNIYLVICRKWAIQKTLQIEWIYHIIAWVVPFICAVFPFLIPSFNQIPTYYGDGGLWCWVSPAYSPFRFIYLGVIWAAFVFTILIYMAVGYQVRRDMITKVPQSGNKVAGSKSRSSRMRFVIITSLYIVAFFLTFIGALANRLALLVGAPSFGLYMFQAITQPAVGVFAAMAYFGRHLFTCCNSIRDAYKSSAKSVTSTNGVSSISQGTSGAIQSKSIGDSTFTSRRPSATALNPKPKPIQNAI